MLNYFVAYYFDQVAAFLNLKRGTVWQAKQPRLITFIR